jgi:hypothetical protein
VFRTVHVDCCIALEHRLTSSQAACLDATLDSARALYAAKVAEGQERVGRGEGIAAQGHVVVAAEEASDRLDKACLDLCISLLDHDLKGPLYQSAVVGYLAVLGIDSAREMFREPPSYSPMLSGFVKIAQLLVIQKAVLVAQQHPGSYLADFLEEMRARFLLASGRSPFSWASRLLVYSKKARDCTTTEGYISWSDNGQSVSYRDVQDLHMDGLRRLVRIQVTKAQEELEGVLLLHPSECRGDLDIAFYLHRVTDNAAEGRNGWNFLQHQANLQGTLPDRKQWLLRRVLQNEWLQDEFLLPSTKAKRSK